MVTFRIRSCYAIGETKADRAGWLTSQPAGHLEIVEAIVAVAEASSCRQNATAGGLHQ